MRKDANFLKLIKANKLTILKLRAMKVLNEKKNLHIQYKIQT